MMAYRHISTKNIYVFTLNNIYIKRATFYYKQNFPKALFNNGTIIINK